MPDAVAPATDGRLAARGGQPGVTLIHTPRGARAANVIAAVAAIGVAAAAGALVVWQHSALESLEVAGYAGAFGLAAIGNANVGVPFPWLLIVGPMGSALSPQWLTVWATAGAVLGAMVPYVLGVGIPLPRFLAGLGGRPNWQKAGIVVLVSLVPVLSYPTFAAGILRMRILPSLLITAIAEATKIWFAVHIVPAAIRALGL